MQLLKKQTRSTEEKLHTILQWIDEAEAIVIGGASGMSAACGYDYYSHHNPFFEQYFSDFGEIYNEPSLLAAPVPPLPQ